MGFRLLWDTKGRMAIHKIHRDEATYKLCRVRRTALGSNALPYIVTHDGRTVRFPDPDVKSHDTVRLDIGTGKILDHIKFEVGNLVVVTGGNNIGRVGTLHHREKHSGSFEIVHIKDTNGHHFVTRLQNVMAIGKDDKPWISLPANKGLKSSIIDD